METKVKLVDALRERKIYNDHGLLLALGGKTDICISYAPYEHRSVRTRRTHVYSPSHHTDPDAWWGNHGKKTFIGKRSESMPKAIAWASEKYGITEWSTSPFGGSKIPACVLVAAKEFVKS